MTSEMAAAGHVYGAFGLRIGAPFAIPALRPAEGKPDILVHRLPGEKQDEPADAADWRVEGAVFSFEMGGGLSFRVEGGNRIEVRAAPETSERDLLTWLTGPVIGAALIQRGMLVVHGNAVAYPEGKAAAMVGPTRAGKSTAAAALHAAGLEPLADDLVGIDFGVDGRPRVWPGIPRVKLMPEAAAALGIDVRNAPFVGAGMIKHEVGLPSDLPWDRPFVLERLYLLDKGALEIEPLLGRQAAAALLDNLFWPEAQGIMPGVEDRFVRSMRLADAVRSFTYRRPFDLERLGATTEALIAHLRAPA